MLFEILTLFPSMLEAPLSESVLGKARESGIIEVRTRNIRDFAEGRHRVCDDAPYGGGAGMVMKPEPLVSAIEESRARTSREAHVILLTPQGRLLDQRLVEKLAAESHIVLVCGRYEGVDERVREFVDSEVSVGDYVVSGGEPAAWILVDAVSRLIPGVLGNDSSAEADSFSQGLLEHPHYTRPPDFRGRKIPEDLLSGDHARIAKWRRKQALIRTKQRRRDLLDRLELTDEDQRLLEEAEEELARNEEAS